MRSGWLGDRDVQDIARQAADLLYPPATVSVEALNRGGRFATWGGLSMSPRRPRRVTVRIGPGNQCMTGVDPDWTPVHTLAHLLDALAGACHHNFRGAWFPSCPGHEHAALIEETTDEVILRCPEFKTVVGRLRPDFELE